MSTKITTGTVRLSYANVWSPKAANSGAEPKYSVSLIISKNDTKTIEAINKAVQEALTEGVVSKFGGKMPPKSMLKLPMRDGDEERPDDAAYKNSYFLNATSKTAPGIVDRHVQPILDHSEVYSGVFARVSLNFYAYSINGNKGVAAGLGNIQKVRDGEALGGKTAPSADFESIDDDDDFMS